MARAKVTDIASGLKRVLESDADPYDISSGLIVAHFAAHHIHHVANGGSVDYWRDMLGLDALSNSTVSEQPTWHADQLSGYPIVRFDDTASQYLSGGKAISVQTAAAVVKFDDATFTEFGGLYTSTAVDGSQQPLMNNSSGTTMYTSSPFECYIDGTTTDSDDLVTPSQWHIVLTATALGAYALTGSQIGRDRVNSARHLDADVAEVIVFNEDMSGVAAAKRAARAEVFNYLNNKYQVY